MKKAITIIIGIVLLVACGQSYEETKRISREQRREAMRRDSAALKIAVLPTLDCLPLFVAQQERLLDTLNGGVRLKMYRAQMDCDTAVQRGRAEGMVTDLVRALRINNQGVKMRYVTATNAYWQLITNRQARIRQLKQLDHKMVGMARYSVTDLLSDYVADSAKIAEERFFKVQLNDVNVRMSMLQNNEIDAVWLTEPQATVARVNKHAVIYDSRTTGLHFGVMAFREQEMRRPERAKQLELLIKAYNKACDLINEQGLQHYRQLIMERCKVKAEVVDSLPADLKYQHAQGTSQQDMTAAEKWLEEAVAKSKI